MPPHQILWACSVPWQLLSAFTGMTCMPSGRISWSGAALGVVTSASVTVAVIEQARAQAQGLVTNYAIKQVDRPLSNQNIGVRDAFAR
jgi:hypothetical protein